VFWADLGPQMYYEHLGSLVVVSARDGRVLIHVPTFTWPMVDGHGPPFLRSAGAFNSQRYRVLARGGSATLAAPDARTATRMKRSRAARFVEGRRPAARIAANASQCMVVLGPPDGVGVSATLNPFQWIDHLNDAQQMSRLASQKLGVRVYSATDLGSLNSALGNAVGGGCTDVMLFITGEGFGSPTLEVPPALQDWVGGAKVIGSTPQAKTEVAPGQTITDKQLADALKRAYDAAPANAKPQYTIVIQQCFGGRMIPGLQGTPGLAAVAVSSDPNSEAARNAVAGASPFVNSMTDGLQNAFGAAGGKISWPDAVAQAFGYIVWSDGTQDDPQLLVNGKLLSARDSRTVGVHVWLMTLLGPGSITLAPPGTTYSISQPQSPIQFSLFEPLGTTLTLTATPRAGYYFDGWESGSECGTDQNFPSDKNPYTCTVNQNTLTTVQPDTFRVQMSAVFEKCPPPGTFVFNPPATEVAACPGLKTQQTTR
jgi:Divergent InlB B-repeat domain